MSLFGFPRADGAASAPVFAKAAPRPTAPAEIPFLPRGRRAAASTPEPHSTDSREVAFRRLFSEHWPRVHRHLSCYVENRDEVDEIAADVFFVAWRKLDPARPMPLTWFLRTADNKLRDRTRRAHSRERALDALVRGLQNPEQPLDPLEAVALRKALISLSARERQIVVLTYWDELSAGEVAAVLRTSQSAVWTTLTRARAKLRSLLDGGASA